MVITADGPILGVSSVPAEITGPGTGPPGGVRTFSDQKAEAERRIVMVALESNEWHVTRTAEQLGLADHASLLKIIRRLGIERPS